MRQYSSFVWTLTFVVGCALLTPSGSSAGSLSTVRRELLRMTGYTIVGVSRIADIKQEEDTTIITLRNEAVFAIEREDAPLWLSRASFSDVVVFSKSSNGAQSPRLPTGSDPLKASYRLLIRDEIVKARRVEAKRVR